MSGTYGINEIFFSLQGEGFHVGTPAVFIRFSGCNLHCAFCDTQHEAHVPMTADQIVRTVSRYDAPLIVLTGGEPSLQSDQPLIRALRRLGRVICIETNGTHPLPQGIDWITCSPKAGTTPVLRRADELKVVYTGSDNVEDWRQLISADHCFLQPCSGQNTDEVVRYILQHPHWRLSLQTHKLINIR
ncbi:MAG: radical SAM protein [Paludibacteraceae bacterium]|nr:radical SAM protein [Paludibacteraceae bacterium]